jgi:propionate CoA-transferase
MRSKVMSADEAVRLIVSGDTVTPTGSAGVVVPDLILAALGRRFVETGEPRDLTILTPIAVGDLGSQLGLDHVAKQGLIKRIIAGSYVNGTPEPGRSMEMTRMIVENEVEAYNLPLGVMMHLMRDIAARKPGVLTKMGIGTYMDPREGGGRLNERASEDIVKVVELEGEEWLLYRAMPVNVALIRGTTADEDGNVTMEHEGMSLGNLAQALAAHNCGGRVIAQVKRVVKRGTLNPQLVRVPGAFVDAVVVDEGQLQAPGLMYNPATTGEIRVPVESLASLPLTPEKVVARRAAMEMRSGWLCHLGVGTSGMVPRIAVEEGLEERVTFTVEQGAIGGVSLNAPHMGLSINPAAILDAPTQFDYIQGGGFDVAFLALAEVDRNGSVNVSWLPKLPHVLGGCGGFIEISQSARKLVFCGLFSAGGAQLGIRDGALRIEAEGRHCKFVDRVQHLTFNGRLAAESDQDVTYITERAVFKLTREGLMLVEVAPGIDAQRDVVQRMQFQPLISPTLAVMDVRLFREARMGLSLP